jgi:hypothetical protein
MVYFSLRVLVGEVLQRKDGCPMTTVGHDGRKMEALSTIPGMIGKSPLPLFLMGEIRVGHDKDEKKGEDETFVGSLNIRLL